MGRNSVVDSSIRQQVENKNRLQDLYNRLFTKKRTKVYAVDTSSPKIQNTHPSIERRGLEELLEQIPLNEQKIGQDYVETLSLNMDGLLKKSTSKKIQGMSRQRNAIKALSSSPKKTINIITTDRVVLVNFELANIIKILQDKDLSTSTIQILILRPVKILPEDYTDIDDYYNAILHYHIAFFELMKLIKGMSSITHLELSNFTIDISNFFNKSKQDFVDYLFKNILNKKALKHFNFNDNAFIDDVKEREYSSFIELYNNKNFNKHPSQLVAMRIRLLFLLEWACNNNIITQNPDSYIYKKWLEWLAYEKISPQKHKSSFLKTLKLATIEAEWNKIYTDDKDVQGFNVDKTTEHYKEFIRVWNTPNKGFYLQTEGFYRDFYTDMKDSIMKSFVPDEYCKLLAERNEGFYKAFDETEYGRFLLKKGREKRSDILIIYKPTTKKEKIRDEWFKWLLSNNTVAGITFTNKYDDIVERLFIVIEGFKEAFDKGKVNGLNNYEYDSFLSCLIYSIVISFDEEVMKNIIREFDINKYNPTEYNLTEKFNDIIANKARDKITFTTLQFTKELSGGRKTKTKVAREAPKKTPKISLKAPKKTPKISLKAPKKTPKQPKVAREAPKKTPKQPKVAREAPKKTPKQPKVALKETKKPSKAPNKTPKQPTKQPNIARKVNKKK